ncbi:MAG: DUF1097 domain-containing protein [Phycisphaerae bacterium]|jgi:hypothetical protein|nr:DUF1097 domain-containing protein [Phycisphaerae bacterium]
MTFKQFFPIPVVIAVLAFLLMLVNLGASHCPNYGKYFVIWVAFQAWAMYFMAGCTLKNGVKVMLGYLGGALASIAIMELGGQFAKLGLGEMALPVAVLIIVVPVICAERVPMFDFVPAWFVGAGVFFALCKGPETYIDTGIMSLFSCLIGVIFGIVTVVFRMKYEASLKLKSAE